MFGEASGAPEPFDVTQLTMYGSATLSYPSGGDFSTTPEQLRARAGEVFQWMAEGSLRMKWTALPLGEAFHARRLTLRSSQVGQLPADRRPRWTYARRLAVALDLAADPTLDVLFEGAWIDFDELHEAIPRVCGDGASGLCHRISYPGGYPPRPPANAPH